MLKEIREILLSEEKEKWEEIFRDEMPIYSFFLWSRAASDKKNRRVVKEVVKVWNET